MQGWPKLHVEVWHQDQYARNELGAWVAAMLPQTDGAQWDTGLCTCLPHLAHTTSSAPRGGLWAR